MRFRPRFTVRTLAIFVTLIGAYFGAWEITKKHGLPSRNINGMYIDPFNSLVVSTDEPRVLAPFLVRHVRYTAWNAETCHGYYIWLFGPKIQLPFVSE
jgi:hypothetical protein